MADVRTVQVQSAVGGAQSIEISGPEDVSGLSSVTIAVTFDDGTTLSRAFSGTRDEYQDRSRVDHPGGTRTYTSVLGIDDAALDTQLASELITDEERGPNLHDDDRTP